MKKVVFSESRVTTFATFRAKQARTLSPKPDLRGPRHPYDAIKTCTPAHFCACPRGSHKESLA